MIPIILAGGSGTRFWPLSRRSQPKQLLSILGDGQTMIQTTLKRLTPLASQGVPVQIVCSAELVEPTERALSKPHSADFIIEPAPRNTAPAITLATAVVEARFGDEPIAFFPADHFVAGQDEFESCLRLAATRAASAPAIITLGVPPTRPETGYGYIRCKTIPSLAEQTPTSLPVEAFEEKPTHERARRFLQERRYLWNSGIFVFRPSTLWAEFERQDPIGWPAVEALRRAVQANDQPDIARKFQKISPKSIDYAIMEGAAQVEVIPVRFQWSDVGHWDSLSEVLPCDDAGNVVEADAIVKDSQGCVIISRGGGRLIAALGLKELVIVDTKDALLILPRNQAQKVRTIVDLLKEQDRPDLL